VARDHGHPWATGVLDETGVAKSGPGHGADKSSLRRPAVPDRAIRPGHLQVRPVVEVSMIINPQVSLHRLVLSLADAMDCVHSEISNHQHRVTYISTNVARSIGYRGQELLDIFLAGALHDIGLIRAENRVALVTGRLEDLNWHGEAGYRLLKDLALFANAAESIRYHHTPWAGGTQTQGDGRPLPMGSRIILLADEVDRALRRDVFVLKQCGHLKDHIAALAGTQLHPSCVEAFMGLAAKESFWLDCVSDRIYSVLLKQVDWPTLTLDEEIIQPIAETFARLIDASSRWTATHSAGVTATAVALSERLSFSPREQSLMRAAGYLHDLGKLTIPTSILDKPAKLSADETLCMRQHTYHTYRILDTIGGMPQIAEWAAFHHERLDGQGYPFRHRGRDLTLGSRIMAVADVFTAVTEDRPYRKGMSKEEALSVLDRLVQNGGIDGDVVSALRSDFETINDLREIEQAEYAAKQTHLMQSLPCSTDAVAACGT